MREVLQLLNARRDSGSSRQDGASIALIVEGGGMRGVVGSGAVAALLDLGFGHCFDDVYGASAGALSAAYFLTGDAYPATQMYWQLSSGTLLKPSRALRGGPILDVDYLIDDVLVHQTPLDEQAIVAHHTRLHVIATSLRQGCAVDLDGSYGPLRDRLRASTRVQFCTGGPVTLRGEQFIDGYVCEPLPVRRAFADGSTHVLVLRTKPTLPAGQAAVTWSTAKALHRALLLRYPHLRSSGVLTPHQQEQQLQTLGDWKGPGEVLIAAPSGKELSTQSRDAAQLVAGANAGYHMVAAMFDEAHEDDAFQLPVVAASRHEQPARMSTTGLAVAGVSACVGSAAVAVLSHQHRRLASAAATGALV